MDRAVYKEDQVKCPVCRYGELSDGVTSMTFERTNATIVVKKVPAEVCENCGEAFVSEEVARRVQTIVDDGFRKGVEIEVLTYAA